MPLSVICKSALPSSIRRSERIESSESACGTPRTLRPLPPPSNPTPLINPQCLSDGIQTLQELITSFHYHDGKELTADVQSVKERPLAHTLSIGRQLLCAHPRPNIKCLEAVIIAVTATQDAAMKPPMNSECLWRIPLRFHSTCGAHSYWHIVCILSAITVDQDKPKRMFGAVGISRVETLAYRPMIYTSLSSIIDSFTTAYHHIEHVIDQITVGLPIADERFSKVQLHWHFLSIPLALQDEPIRHNGLSCSTAEWRIIVKIIDKYQAELIHLHTEMRKHARAAIAPLHRSIRYDAINMQLIYTAGRSKPATPSRSSTSPATSDQSDERVRHAV